MVLQTELRGNRLKPYVDKARLGGSTSPVVRLTEGGSMGDLYINRDFKRDNNGYIYLDAKTGLPSMVETEYKKIGSLLPKVNLGWRNSFTYKGLRLNILLSGRFVVWLYLIHKLSLIVVVFPNIAHNFVRLEE